MNDKPILLVEDNPDDRDLTIRAFKKNNVLNPIVVAMDGAEALTMLLGDDHREEDSPALILLDLKLPKVDGLEVLRRIRADPRTRVLPVVVLTSSKEDEGPPPPPTTLVPTATSASPSSSANSPRRYAPSACTGSSSINHRRNPGIEQAIRAGEGHAKVTGIRGGHRSRQPATPEPGTGNRSRIVNRPATTASTTHAIVERRTERIRQISGTRPRGARPSSRVGPKGRSPARAGPGAAALAPSP